MRTKQFKQFLFIPLLVLTFFDSRVNAEKITLFDNEHFQGESIDIDAEEGKCINLPGDWSDRASSISTHDNCVLIFEHGNCHGRSARVARGTPNHHSLANMDFNDIITSIQLCTPPEKACTGIIVDMDTSEAPDLHHFGLKVKSLLEKWYPTICRVLISDTYLEVNRISVKIDPNAGGVAGADAFGRSITGNANFYRDHPDDLGSMIHEMAHIIQRYDRCSGWLTEGIADWTRRILYEREKPARPSPGDSYHNNPVQFLEWMLERYPNSMYVLNQECRRGTYNDDIFPRLTGKTLSQLSDDMKRETQQN